MKKLLACAGILAMASAASAATISFDFDTDQSGSFTTVEHNGPDSSIDYSYDYSTHTQDVGSTNVPIPSSPNASGGTTLGVRVDVNLALGAANSLTLYPDLTGVDLSGGDYTLTFDVWANHNGDAGGATGSTEFWGFGAQDDLTSPGIGGDGDNGFNYIVTGDGGSSNDFRYSSGSPMVGDNSVPNWNGANEVNQTAAGWGAFFPNDGTLGTPPSGSVSTGASGKQWLTVQLAVSNSGADRVVSFKKSGDAGFTVVSTIIGGDGATDQPCIGYADFFSSLAVPAADNFVVFDNLVIDDSPGSSIDDWAMHE